MHKILTSFFAMCVITGCFNIEVFAQKAPRFKVVALAEMKDRHQPFVDAAMTWLNKVALDSGFTVDYIETPEAVTDAFLSKYQLFIQLNFPPYMWSDVAKKAFEKYISEGEGGWIGFHHATLLGEFDGYAVWPWFSDFMGKIRFKNYIATFVAADVVAEDMAHPTMKGVASPFRIAKEEFYTYDVSPRASVHVIASVNEDTYTPPSNIKMGDHPVIWSNPNVKAKNVYIFMGHDPGLFDNAVYRQLFLNSIFWACRK